MSTTTAPPERGLGQQLVRVVGWVFIGAGAVLLLYLVWLLWFTGVGTSQAQQGLLDEFPGFGTTEPGGDLFGDTSRDTDEDRDGVVTASGGVAVMEFERPGTDDPPVNDNPLVVVAGTDTASLQRGPGAYTDTAGPGEPGNFVIVGHRTTYGAPFYDIDDLRPDDLVHVTDPEGVRTTYRILDGDTNFSPGLRLISPTELWVLNSDPLGLGSGTYITLISCHPRFSASQRIVAFGERVESDAALDTGDADEATT